ncbi:MFS transporter [Citricoccus zhacaiensis]
MDEDPVDRRLLAFLLFLRLQRTAGRRGTEALVPLESFRHPNFALCVGAVFTLGFTVYSVTLPIMLYLQEAQGLSAELAGLMLLPMGVVSVVMSPVIGRLTDRVSPGRISRIGFTALITALFGVFMHLGVGPG